MDNTAGFKMRSKCLRRPAGLKELHEVGGGEHLDAEAPDQLYRPRIHQPDVGNVIQGRVLHDHTLLASQNGL